MARTDLDGLRTKLRSALDALESFEEPISPVDSSAVLAMWNGKMDGQTARVVVRKNGGALYQGRITGASTNACWTVLADNGEMIRDVSADSFVAIRLRFL